MTLGRFVGEKPDATPEERRVRVKDELGLDELGLDELGLSVSVGCLWNTPRRMKLTYKKSRSSPRSS